MARALPSILVACFLAGCSEDPQIPGAPSVPSSLTVPLAPAPVARAVPASPVLPKPKPIAPPEPAKPPEPRWIAADSAAELGDMRVQVNSVQVGKVSLKGPFGVATHSEDDLVLITLNLTNINSKKKLEYDSWSGHTISAGDDIGILKDNLGNSYKRMHFGFATMPNDAIERETPVYPDASILDAIVFERPLESAEYLELTLPAKNYGGEGVILFRIPASMIKRKSR